MEEAYRLSVKTNISFCRLSHKNLNITLRYEFWCISTAKVGYCGLPNKTVTQQIGRSLVGHTTLQCTFDNQGMEASRPQNATCPLQRGHDRAAPVGHPDPVSCDSNRPGG